MCAPGSCIDLDLDFRCAGELGVHHYLSQATPISCADSTIREDLSCLGRAYLLASGDGGSGGGSLECYTEEEEEEEEDR